MRGPLSIQVYMDAVFFPRAINDPLVLAQEGWHYEIEKKDDPLTFKGSAGVQVIHGGSSLTVQ